jgi:hypothetical protein
MRACDGRQAAGEHPPKNLSDIRVLNISSKIDKLTYFARRQPDGWADVGDEDARWKEHDHVPNTIGTSQP